MASRSQQPRYSTPSPMHAKQQNRGNGAAHPGNYHAIPQRPLYADNQYPGNGGVNNGKVSHPQPSSLYRPPSARRASVPNRQPDKGATQQPLPHRSKTGLRSKHDPLLANNHNHVRSATNARQYSTPTAAHGAVSSSHMHQMEMADHSHHHHHHDHHHAHTGSPTAARREEQQAEQCRVYCLQFFVFYLYAVYMIVLCGPLLVPKVTWIGVTLCTVFNVSFVLMTIAFWQCATMDPGEVPPPRSPRPKHAKFCVKCHNAKPERTHHCSTCGKCVLNMDHHCPWLANCVGFHNRQFFILILLYGVVCSSICTVHGFVYMFTTAPYVWPRAPELAEVEGKAAGMIGFFSVCVLLFFALVLFIGLITFARFHLSLVFTNATTIETTFNRANTDDYHLGSCWMNCKQVFGNQWYLWWCPIWREPLGDGYTWGRQLLDQLDMLEKGESRGAEMSMMVRRPEDHRHR